MSDSKFGNQSGLMVAIAIVVIAAIGAGAYIYEKNQNQKTFSLQIGDQTISATVKAPK